MIHQERPVWYEGMTLDPHHFQQWDRYIHGVLRASSRATLGFDWGLTSLEIDREALSNGVFSVKYCAGIMSDGLCFDMPGANALPEPRAIEKSFPPSDETLPVYLAVPVERSTGGNCPIDDAGMNRRARFLYRTITVVDDNTGLNERSIGVGEPNFQILFGSEKQGEFSTIRVADVVRTPDARYALSTRFIPPSLSLRASEQLMTVVRKLFEVLVARSAALTERRREQKEGHIECTKGDLQMMGVLRALNCVIPVLQHEFKAAHCHPEQAYRLLASLAGELTTYASDATLRPSDLLAYDHENADRSFRSIEERIVRVLDEALEANFATIPLDRRSEARWVGKLTDDTGLRRGQLILIAGGEISERKLADELPRKIKIGGPEDIDRLVTSALPGLPIILLSRPPAGSPVRSGSQYFRLDKSGPLWDAIRRQGAIALFVPSEFRGIILELVALHES